jgi:hypothetical protein
MPKAPWLVVIERANPPFVNTWETTFGARHVISERRATRRRSVVETAIQATSLAPSANRDVNHQHEPALNFITFQNDIPLARKTFERALELDPDFASARLCRRKPRFTSRKGGSIGFPHSRRTSGTAVGHSYQANQGERAGEPVAAAFRRVAADARRYRGRHHPAR